MLKKVNLMLDSGAFSAFTKNVEINIYDYIKFIKKNEKYITHYINLDVIGDPVKTYENQKIMEGERLKPIPAFHVMFESKEWLKKYIDEGYDYIGLGGMAGTKFTKKDFINKLNPLFEFIICDKLGMPKVKIHGFGMTSLDLMLRYPWYSVDSTSWVMTSRYGAVLIPITIKGEYRYDKNPLKVNFSLKSPSIKEEGKHYSTFTQLERKEIDKYLDLKGYSIGESEIKQEDKKGYKLKEGERRFGKVDADAQRSIFGTDKRGGYVIAGHFKDGLIETVITTGLCNDYRLRDELCIIYYKDLEDSMPKWPWPFVQPKQTKLGVFSS